jgi:molybdenum cofactor biosynthesis enzyme
MARAKARRLTHFDARGAARMVDVGEKPETSRVAVATGAVEMAPATLALVAEGKVGKGDVLGIATHAPNAGGQRALVSICAYFGAAVPASIAGWFLHAFPDAELRKPSS